jgi:hypothetical protein
LRNSKRLIQQCARTDRSDTFQGFSSCEWRFQVEPLLVSDLNLQLVGIERRDLSEVFIEIFEVACPISSHRFRLNLMVVGAENLLKSTTREIFTIVCLHLAYFRKQFIGARFVAFAVVNLGKLIKSRNIARF